MCKILNDSRVHITAAGSHNKTFHWCHTHTGIYNFSVLYSGNTGAVTKVADNNFRIIRVQVQHLNRTLGNKAVACSVEAVTTYFIFFIILIWKTVHISNRFHSLMKGGIKYTDVWHARHNCLTSADTD